MWLISMLFTSTGDGIRSVRPLSFLLPFLSPGPFERASDHFSPLFLTQTVRQHYLPSYKLELGRAITLRGVFPTSLISDMDDFPVDSWFVGFLPFSFSLSRSRSPFRSPSFVRSHWWGPDRAFFTSPLGLFALPLSPSSPLPSNEDLTRLVFAFRFRSSRDLLLRRLPSRRSPPI